MAHSQMESYLWSADEVQSCSMIDSHWNKWMQSWKLAVMSTSDCSLYCICVYLFTFRCFHCLTRIWTGWIVKFYCAPELIAA